ncbi:MAG: WD40 repeat domain-containing protein [Pseudomonadota bacterium]
MSNCESWNWEIGSNLVADLNSIPDISDGYLSVRECLISHDGERVALPVRNGEGGFFVWTNKGQWEGAFEKAWSLKFTQDNRLTALVRLDDMWTVGVEGALWEERFAFVWNTKFSGDGSAIGVQVKKEMEYSIAVNGKSWGKGYISCRDFAISADGKKIAAAVQVEGLAEGDIFKFMDGTWSVSVDEKVWDEKFINVYSPIFSSDGKHVAAQVRLDICEYSIAQDGKPWQEGKDGAKYSSVWESIYRPSGSFLLAPVRLGGAWTVFENGERLWNGDYVQVWNLRLSPDGKRVAAVVAPAFGRWTVCVDDKPWKISFSDAVLAPVFSSDGQRVAAAVRDEGSWSVAVDGKRWSMLFDMVWNPVFNPNGNMVAAKVQQDGKFAIAVDGRIWEQGFCFDSLSDPVFSSDGKKLLVCGIEEGKCFRRVVPLE